MKKKITIILLILFALQFGFRIYQYRADFLNKYDAKYWKMRYEHSQWVVPNSKESIGGDGLYAFAGWEYIHGKDPSLLNAETPPFAKYMIGLSEIIFQNQNIFALLSGILVLIALFILNKLIFKDTLLALIPVAFFSAEPLFYSQLRAPYIDNLYLGLLLLTFIFVLKEKFFLANIFIGLMTATKASTPTFFILNGVIIAYLFYMNDTSKIKKFLSNVPIAILTFLLTYTQYFLLGHNLRQFLGVQKYILTFYGEGAKGVPYAAMQMLLSGQWPTWWGTIEKILEWNILWPLSFIATLYYLYRVIPKRRQYRSIIFAFWVVAYLIFLTLVPVWTRYLLMVLPFMYTLSVWVLSKNIPKYLLKSKLRKSLN